MEYYKSTCPKCNTITFWTGPSTFLVQTIYPHCRSCKFKTTASHRVTDRVSLLGSTYERKIMEVLSK